MLQYIFNDVDPILNPQALPIATSISNNDTLEKPG